MPGTDGEKNALERGRRPGRTLATSLTAVRAVIALAARAAPWQTAGCVLASLVSGIIPVATAWLTKLLLDRLVGHAPMSSIVALAASLGAVGAATLVLPRLIRFLTAEVEREAGLLARERLYTAVGDLPGLSRFEDPDFLDRLRLAQNACGTGPGQVLNGLLGGMRSLVTVVGFAGALVSLTPLLAPLLLLSGILTLVMELSLARRRTAMMLRIGPMERREIFYSDLLSTVEAAKEIRLFNIGGLLRERMLRERRHANSARRAVDLRELTGHGALGLVAAALAAAGTLWAAYQVHEGLMTVGGVVVFVTAIGNTQSTLGSLAEQVAHSQEAVLLFEHYRTITATGSDLPVADDPRPAAGLSGGIEFQDVWFRYSDDHPWVLKGVDLRIPAGSSMALVGLNGAGKSTLVKLLCRFYDPGKGRILWDGVDIRDIDLESLRKRISTVFQDYMQYDMTVAENIGLGDISAMDDPRRVRKAAERAGVDRAVEELPHGYETLLSRLFFMESEKESAEHGVILSGGQWQRLALARAVFRDGPDLVILDEPSSGLDAEAEHEIHRSLRRYRRGRTSLLISHRLGAVRDADTIVVLAGGRAIEEGSHEELIAADGAYARLFNLQATSYRGDA
ncbi:ABC transporter ATP-binding protein [Actinomadura sp. NEAU-AAG7]|uniref:ABC transporter ATP-binding protein n=1 Tax=Actinomadura sp. NEAU-AAG7 TaxID=2839640 RepID=UPI0020326E20|nr:ABC transporter ATP-binding protein [Actinomadura sp. NEAU-AAG7]